MKLRRLSFLLPLLALHLAQRAAAASAAPEGNGWISIFDGKSLDGWKVAEKPDSIRIEDGNIVANGPRAHLFYVGDVAQHDFKDFELKLELKTLPNANSGVYFHTRYQERDWPKKGIEVQVNNSFAADPIRTGSLYQLQNVLKTCVEDDEWFTLHVAVRGRHVVVKINDETVVDYTQPEDFDPSGPFDRKISRGTFALQAHDPGSKVCYRKILVRPLESVDFPVVDFHVHLKGGLTLEEAVGIARKRGVKFGIAQNCGVGFPVTDDEGAKRFLAGVEGQPVFKGMQAEGREWVKLFSKEVIAKFDYVLTDAMTFFDKSGKRVRLWIDGEVDIVDKQEFMDFYVDQIVAILKDEPIDIYANATFLPRAIAGDYDALWTEARMDRVIRAAVEGAVAIEINAKFRIPSATFVARARKAGVKFSFGTNNGDRDLGELEYSIEVAEKCGLTQADMFTPKPDGDKPVQRKK